MPAPMNSPQGFWLFDRSSRPLRSPRYLHRPLQRPPAPKPELRPPRPGRPALKLITPTHQDAVQPRDQLGALIHEYTPAA